MGMATEKEMIDLVTDTTEGKEAPPETNTKEKEGGQGHSPIPAITTTTSKEVEADQGKKGTM